MQETVTVKPYWFNWMAVWLLLIGGCPSDQSGPRRVVRRPRAQPPPAPPTPPPTPLFAQARRHVYTGPQVFGRSADFSPDGKLLAVGGAFGGVRLVDLRTGKTLRTLQSGEDELDRPVHVRFTPRGDHLLAAGYDTCALKVWQVASGRLLRTIPLGRAVHGLEVTTGTRVAVASTGWAAVLDWRTGRELHRVDMPYGLAVRQVALDAKATRLAMASAVGHLRLVDVTRREPLAQGRVETSRVTALALHPRGQRLAVGLESGNLRLLQGASLTRVRAFRWEHRPHPVVGLRFAGDGRRLLALTAKGDLLELDAATGKLLATRSILGSPCHTLVLSRDGLLAAAPRQDRRLAIWQSTRGRSSLGLPDAARPRPPGPRATMTLPAPLQHRLTVPTGGIVSVALSRTGTRVVLGHHPPALSAWTLRGRPAPRFTRLWRRRVTPPRGAKGLRYLRVALSPRDRWVYLHGPTDRLRRYSLAGGWPLPMRPTGARELRSLLPTPDGRLWITTTAKARVHLWSPLGVRRHSFEAMPRPYWVGVSPDSKRLVEVGGVDDLAVFDLGPGKHRGRRLWHRQGHPHRMLEVMALRFAPDSKRLLSYHRSGFLRVYDATTGRRLGHRRIPTPPGLVSCALRPDTRVLACAVGSAIRFYEVATGALLRVVRPRPTSGKVLGLGYSNDGSTVLVLETARQLRLLRFP